MQKQAKHWLVIPSGGVGKRFDGNGPKQLQKSEHGKTLLQESVEALTAHMNFSGVMIAGKMPQELSYLQTKGGIERAESVLNGINALKQADDDDWIWVHDAVRPMVSKHDIDALISVLEQTSTGALLVTPIPATVKQVKEQKVHDTIERESLFLAQTPQVMKKGKLQEALARCLDVGFFPTDESQAMEKIGLYPKVVLGQRTNIKITYPEDMAFYNYYLKSQKNTEEKHEY